MLGYFEWEFVLRMRSFRVADPLSARNVSIGMHVGWLYEVVSVAERQLLCEASKANSHEDLSRNFSSPNPIRLTSHALPGQLHAAVERHLGFGSVRAPSLTTPSQVDIKDRDTLQVSFWSSLSGSNVSELQAGSALSVRSMLQNSVSIISCLAGSCSVVTEMVLCMDTCGHLLGLWGWGPPDTFGTSSGLS